jgi:alkanesulfonate monooxygenase SsuD/methylene tetrahydromethanopterin reductase-like flavin-dependent oxidoreductase (luciferase family)
MKFLAITLIVHAPHPITGVTKPTTERFREVIDNALLAEELGFDGFGVGERHERPFISSSPPVVLSHIAALTSRIRLFTAVTTLSLLDPVRAYEDYATLDHLSGGRLELIIGKGNGTAQRELFNVTPEDQWERNAESYELLRRIWRSPAVTATPRFRPALHEAEVWPRPLRWSARARPAITRPATPGTRSPRTGRSSTRSASSRKNSACSRSSPTSMTSSRAAQP